MEPHNKALQLEKIGCYAPNFAAERERYAALLTYHKQYIYYLWYVDRL